MNYDELSDMVQTHEDTIIEMSDNQNTLADNFDQYQNDTQPILDDLQQNEGQLMFPLSQDTIDLINESTTTFLTQAELITLLGYTPVPTTLTLTINGTTYDLTANRSWTISTGGNPGGANTNVQYNNSSTFGGSSNFTFDGTTVHVVSKFQLPVGTNLY